MGDVTERGEFVDADASAREGEVDSLASGGVEVREFVDALEVFDAQGADLCDEGTRLRRIKHTEGVPPPATFAPRRGQECRDGQARDAFEKLVVLGDVRCILLLRRGPNDKSPHFSQFRTTKSLRCCLSLRFGAFFGMATKSMLVPNCWESL